MVMALVALLGSMTFYFLKEVDLSNQLIGTFQADISEKFLNKEIISALKNDVNCAASLADLQVNMNSGDNSIRFTDATLTEGINVPFWTGDQRGIRTRKQIALDDPYQSECSPLYSPGCNATSEDCNPAIECNQDIADSFLGVKILSLVLKKSPDTIIYPERGSFIGELSLEGEVPIPNSSDIKIKTVKTNLLIHYLESDTGTSAAEYKIIGCGDIISNDSLYSTYKCTPTGNWEIQKYCGVVNTQKCSLPGGVGDEICCKTTPSGPCGAQALYSCNGFSGKWSGPTGRCSRSIEQDCQSGQSFTGGSSICCSSPPDSECQQNSNKTLFTCSAAEWIASESCNITSNYQIAHEGDQRCYEHFPHVRCLSTSRLKNYKCNGSTGTWGPGIGSCPTSSQSACLSGNFAGGTDLCCATPPNSTCLATSSGSCTGTFSSPGECLGGTYIPRYGGSCSGAYTGKTESGGSCIGGGQNDQVAGRCVYLSPPCFGGEESCPDQNGLFNSICPDIIYTEILKKGLKQRCIENPPCYWVQQSGANCDDPSMNTRSSCEGPTFSQTHCKWIPEYSDETMSCGQNWNGLISQETCTQQSENCVYTPAASKVCSDHVTSVDCRQATIEQGASCAWTDSPGGSTTLPCNSLDNLSCSSTPGCTWVP